MVDGLFFCTTLIGHRKAIFHLCKHDREPPTRVRRRLSRTHAVFGRAMGVGSGVAFKSTESRSVDQPLRIPSVIHLECCISAVVLR